LGRTEFDSGHCEGRDKSTRKIVTRSHDETAFIYALVTALTFFLAIHAVAQNVNESELRYREAVDNNHILLCRRSDDGPRHLFKVSVPNGQMVDLVPSWQKDVDDAAASPDGQYIAFSDSTRPIYVMPTAGGEPRRVVEDGRPQLYVEGTSLRVCRIK
jgi:hypothetical protein